MAITSNTYSAELFPVISHQPGKSKRKLHYQADLIMGDAVNLSERARGNDMGLSIFIGATTGKPYGSKFPMLYFFSLEGREMSKAGGFPESCIQVFFDIDAWTLKFLNSSLRSANMMAG